MKVETVIPRLKEKYQKEIIPEMMKEFGYKNPFQVPRLEKIVINIGVGDATQDPKMMEAASNDLSIITGQKPLITKAKRSIAGFKLRKGNPIGCKVTLRGARMYEFLDRMMNIALPRIRDFRGLSPNSFDKVANYSLGLDEQLIFPEIDYDKVQKVRGMDVTLVTTTKDKESALAFLKKMGMPFKEK